MKKKNTILFIITIAIFIIFLFSSIVIFKYLSQHKIIYNQNENFLKEQEKNGIVFKNINCYYDGKDSQISYTILNKSNETIKLENYEIVIKDEKENILTNIFIGISTNIELAPNEEKIVKNKVLGRDLSNAHTLELKTSIDNNKKNKK